jgi:hypothetical protein
VEKGPTVNSPHSLPLVFYEECDTFVSRNHRSLTATLSLAGNTLSRRHLSEHFLPAVVKQFTQVQDASAAGSERSVLCSETSFCHMIWHKPFSCRNDASYFTWNFQSQLSTRTKVITDPERTYFDRVFLAITRHMLDKLNVTHGYIRTYKHLCHIFDDVDRWFLMAICGKLFAIRDHDVYYVSPISEALQRFRGPIAQSVRAVDS